MNWIGENMKPFISNPSYELNKGKYETIYLQP